MQRHLGGDVLQPFHQEVRRSHARLDRPEGMLNRFAACPHGVWIFIQPALDLFQDMFVFPTCDTTFLARCALILDWASGAGIGSVTMAAPKLVVRIVRI